MPAPYSILDPRGPADFLTNTNDQPITIQTLNVLGNETVTGTLIVTGLTTLNGGVSATGGIGGIQTSTTAASAAIGATETLLLAAPIVAGTTLKAGSLIRITLQGTCTSSNADTATFTLRAGILGTKADASVAAWTATTAGSGSSIPFSATIELVVRTLGATGTGAGSMVLTNNGTTGIAAAAVTIQAQTTATLATTTATFLDITYSSAATSATTFQNVTIEVLQ